MSEFGQSIGEKFSGKLFHSRQWFLWSYFPQQKDMNIQNYKF